MADLPTTVKPIVSTNREVKTRHIEANFGDGYSQRAGDGINTIKDKWNVEWTALSQVNFDELNDFFEEKEGYKDFNWTPPGESTSKKFVCKNWNVSHLGASLFNLSAQFDQVFDM